MSNTHAIAAVTACLQQIVAGAVGGGVDVTTKPLDRPAGAGSASRRVNLFLYAVAPNAAWRNQDLPAGRPGERGRPPLALNLQYLVTAYADDEVESHKLLGEAVGALNDHPVLLAAELASPPRVTSQPNAMFERVHLTLQSLSLEDLSKLWSAFQSQYRLSVAFEASAALIESRHAPPVALPVLALGPNDRGPVAGAGLSRVPVLADLTPRSARASETVTLIGQQLTRIGDAPGTVIVVLSRLGDEVRRIPDAKPVAAADVTVPLPAGHSALRFTLPSGNASLSAGQYGVRVHVTVDDELGPDRTYSSNEIPLSIAPRIAAMAPASVRAASPGTLTITCEPRPKDGQRVRLIVGSREFAPEIVSGATVKFALDKPERDKKLDLGQHVVRLRVDGVDSLRVVTGAAGLEFERPDILTVTP